MNVVVGVRDRVTLADAAKTGADSRRSGEQRPNFCASVNTTPLSRKHTLLITEDEGPDSTGPARGLSFPKTLYLRTPHFTAKLLVLLWLVLHQA